MATTADDPKKTFDVAKPGKTAADATARPIIVTRKPLTKDPMVADNADAETEEKAEAKKPASTKISVAGNDDETRTLSSERRKIVPPGEAASKPPVETSDASSTASTDEEAPSSTQTAESAPAAKEEPEPASNEESDAEASDAAAVDALADEAEAKKVASKESPEEIAKRQAIQKLIESKKYNVEVKQPKSQRSARSVLIFLLVLVCILVGAALAADAGLVTLPVNLPFDLIKNS